MDESKAIDEQTAIIREAGKRLVTIMNKPGLNVDTQLKAEKEFWGIQGYLMDLLEATRGPGRD